MKPSFFPVLTLLLLAGCAGIDQRVYERSHVALYEPLETEVYALQGGKPLIGHNETPYGKPLKNGGTVYERGLSLAGNQRVVYKMDSATTTLEAVVCMDESAPRGATSHVTIFGNDKVVWEADITKGSFEPVKQLFKGAEQLIIATEGSEKAVVDFLEPKMEGGILLRETLLAGRTNYAFQCQSPAFKPFETYTVKGLTLFCKESYEDYGPVIGVSNAYSCAMVAPEHHGMLVHYGPDSLHTYGGTMQSFLQPEEKVVPTRTYSAVVARPKKWKWRLEEDGAIRLLEAPDLLNGVRRSLIYRMNPRSGELQVDAMAKNVSEHDVMICLSLVTRFPAGFPVAIPAEEAKPGYSLVKGSDEGIVCKDGVVVINQLDSLTPLRGPQKLRQREQDEFLLLEKGGGYFQSKPQTPKNGYYPYDGLRMTVYNSDNGVRVSQYGENLKVAPEQTLHVRTVLDMVE